MIKRGMVDVSFQYALPFKTGDKIAELGGLLLMGRTSEPVCEIPVELNRVGIILCNGLNPVAAAREAGIEVESHGMSTVLEYQSLIKFKEVVN